MKRRDSSPDVIALVLLTAALLWLLPEMERDAAWLPFHTEWSGLHLPADRTTGAPLPSLE